MAHAALLAALALPSVLLGGDYSLANQGDGDNADLIMEMSKEVVSRAWWEFEGGVIS
jgi:hypothetical protein